VRDPTPSHRVPQRVLDTFFNKVDVRGDNECWPWRRSLGSHGYGQIGWNGKDGRPTVTTAHRVAWITVHGNIPPLHSVRQICGSRVCENPGHLKLLKTSLANFEAASNNRDKTHCPKGHPYEGENLFMVVNERRCRICALDARHERARRVKALNEFYRRLKRSFEAEIVELVASRPSDFVLAEMTA
jgi:hypothetical protein